MNLDNYLCRANKWMCDDSYVTEGVKVVKEDFDAKDIVAKATEGLAKIIKNGGEDFKGVTEIKKALEDVKAAGDKVSQDQLKKLNDLYIAGIVAVKEKTGKEELKEGGEEKPLEVTEVTDKFAEW